MFKGGGCHSTHSRSPVHHLHEHWSGNKLPVQTICTGQVQEKVLPNMPGRDEQLIGKHAQIEPGQNVLQRCLQGIVELLVIFLFVKLKQSMTA